MPEDVVHLLEPIEVDTDDAESAAMALGIRNRQGQAIVERGSIRKSRQLVMVR